MAKYDATLRSSQMTNIMNRTRGGIIRMCKGTDTALVAPAGADILSEHAVGGAAGSVSTGVLTFSDADISNDASANNTGAPTFVQFIDSSSVIFARFLVPSQIAVTFGGGATQITAGNDTDIDSITITEGNP